MTQLATAEEPFLVPSGALASGGVDIAIGLLREPVRPARLGINKSHVEILAQLGAIWPPIVVRRENFEIIDGLHRYYAAKSVGNPSLKCHFFDGDHGDAFVESVRLNVNHGLPLSLREREAAAIRVLGVHSEWSDRRIGSACGLAPGTVRSLRARSSGQITRLDKRVGADGRSRPIDPARIRRQAELALLSWPDASLREIAQLLGTSPTTVSSVRAGLTGAHRGTEGPAIRSFASTPEWRESAKTMVLMPVAEKGSPPETNFTSEGRSAVSAAVGANHGESRHWSADAALQATPAVCEFSHWFTRTHIDEDWQQQVAVVPLSRIYEIADEARRRARYWEKFGEALERRASERPQQ
jgi:ParB-like chromosome segregation protein Spo0J